MPLCTAEECRSKLADFDVRRGQPHRRQLMCKRLKQVVPDNVTRSGDCGVSPIQVEGPRRLGGGATTLVLMVGCAVRSGGCTISRTGSESVIISDDQNRAVAFSSVSPRRVEQNAYQNEERGPLPGRSDGLLFQD